MGRGVYNVLWLSLEAGIAYSNYDRGMVEIIIFTVWGLIFIGCLICMIFALESTFAALDNPQKIYQVRLAKMTDEEQEKTRSKVKKGLSFFKWSLIIIIIFLVTVWLSEK